MALSFPFSTKTGKEQFSQKCVPESVPDSLKTVFSSGFEFGFDNSDKNFYSSTFKLATEKYFFRT